MHEGFNKPYFYRGACYVRKGNVTRRLDRNVILELVSHRVTFDSLIFEGEYEINEELVEDFLRKTRERRGVKIEPENIQSVLKLNLMDRGKARNGALLLFSRDCSSRFPQAVIKIGFVEAEKIVDEALIEGPLQIRLEEAMSFIQKRIKKGYVVKGLERIESWKNHLESIREALVNALLHRDYFFEFIHLGESGAIRDYCRESR